MSRQVFGWIPFVEERASLENGTELSRSYEIWDYADALVRTPRGPEDYASAIINFKRAIEFRDQILDSIYNFESIPGAVVIKRELKNKHDAKHDIMSALGLMRPTMKESLRKLRNGLIHDASCAVPDTEVCQRLSDFTWYYLRSTDFIAAQPVEKIIFSQEQPPYNCYPVVHLELYIHRSPWSLEIDATLSNDLISPHERHDFVRVRVELTECDGDNTRVKGTICGPEEAQLAIMKRSFTVI